MRHPVLPRMGRAVITAVAVLGLIVLATRLTAQQPPEIKPGPEHAQFKEWEGTWDATIKGMGPESKGTATCKVGLNGLWLLEHFKGDFGGMPFEGYGATSYDPAKKKYINTWIDSMVTSPMITEGTYDKAKKTLTMVGEMPMPGGKTAKVTMTTVTKDTDTRIFTMNGPGPDGKVGEMFTIIYKRRAK